MIEDRSGNFWIGTYDGGVSKFDGRTFTNFTKKEGLSDNQVFKIFEDSSGNIWFGTREGGLTKYDGKTFIHYNIKGGLLGNGVVGICQDHTGILWFATDGGLTRFDGKLFTRFTEKDGLSGDKVFSIIEDKSGNFWAGTTVGFNKLSQKALFDLTAREQVASANKPEEIEKEVVTSPLFKSYSYEDGFLGIGCTLALTEDRNGDIWIGTNDRITIYHPAGDKPNSIPPNIQLTHIALFNESIQWAKDTSFVLSNGLTSVISHLTASRDGIEFPVV